MKPGTPKRPIIAVVGSGSLSHAALAAPLGRWLAARGYHLLTGGGRGVMEAVSRAFAETRSRSGSVIGVLPASCDAASSEPPPGYPNAWVEIAVRTHLPARGEAGADNASRNHIVVLSADAVIALPGGAGTASEVRLALRYGRPVAAYFTKRSLLAGLPPEVPLLGSLTDVARFLRSGLDEGDGQRVGTGASPV